MCNTAFQGVSGKTDLDLDTVALAVLGVVDSDPEADLGEVK